MSKRAGWVDCVGIKELQATPEGVRQDLLWFVGVPVATDARRLIGQMDDNSGS